MAGDLTIAARPRIVLIHALRDSLAPIHAAFRAGWPEAATHDLLDSALSADHADDGGVLTPRMIERFLALGRYAATAGAMAGRPTDAILFTCSAFGAAIDAVKRAATIPVLKPNEPAFEEALALGPRIGLLVTFPPSLPALSEEVEAAAAAACVALRLDARVVDGALAALQSGDGATHDRLIADAAATLPPVDAVVLGQFSMARAAAAVRARVAAPVLTTPDSAVAALRRRLTA